MSKGKLKRLFLLILSIFSFRCLDACQLLAVLFSKDCDYYMTDSHVYNKINFHEVFLVFSVYQFVDTINNLNRNVIKKHFLAFAEIFHRTLS